MNEGAHPQTHRLQALLDEELPQAAAERVRAHVDDCPACRGKFEALAAMRARLSAEPASVPRPVWPAVERGMRKRDTPRPALALGATVACAAGLTLGILLGSGGDPSEPAASAKSILIDDGTMTSLLDVYESTME